MHKNAQESTEIACIVGTYRVRDWRKPFLRELSLTGNVWKACEAADINRCTATRHKQNDPEFAQQYQDALDTFSDRLESELIRRAYFGTPEPVIYQGKVQGFWVDDEYKTVSETTPGANFVPLTILKYSDPLLMFAVKAKKRAEYGDTPKGTIVNVNNTATAQAGATAQGSGVPRLTRDEFKALSTEEKVRYMMGKVASTQAQEAKP